MAAGYKFQASMRELFGMAAPLVHQHDSARIRVAPHPSNSVASVDHGQAIKAILLFILIST